MTIFAEFLDRAKNIPADLLRASVHRRDDLAGAGTDQALRLQLDN
jgi:hypothetical protein